MFPSFEELEREREGGGECLPRADFVGDEGRWPTPHGRKVHGLPPVASLTVPFMDHDAAHKFIYALREVVVDLLRLVVPDLVDELDLATLEDLSSEFFDDEHRKRAGDMVWRACFLEGTLGNGEKPCLLVLIEFQSTVDRNMAKRMREYTDLLLERLARRGVVKREGNLPWMLPIVVYNGSERWTAPGEASELAPLPSARAERDLMPLQPQKYWRFDAGARSPDDWPAENRVAATVRLQRSGSSRELLLARLREEMERFPGAENEAFRRALYAWAKALEADRTGGGLELPSFEEMEQAEGAEMTTLLEANLNRWDAKVRAEMRAEMRAEIRAENIERERAEEGRRLGRQAALKFDAHTAERLSVLLEGMTVREDLDRVSDWIIECATGEELLSRVSALRAPARTVPVGNAASRA